MTGSKVPHDKQKIQGKEREAMIEHYNKSFEGIRSEDFREAMKRAGVKAQKQQQRLIKEYYKSIRSFMATRKDSMYESGAGGTVGSVLSPIPTTITTTLQQDAGQTKSPLNKAIDNVRASNESNYNLLLKLRDRLQPVLKMEGGALAEENKNPDGETYSQALEKIAVESRNMGLLLESIIERLEV